MSDKFLKNEELRIKKLSRQMEKYQRKHMRCYLKKVRFKIKRKRRYLIYGLSFAVLLYLSSIWQLREKILSVREKEVIEYEMPQWTGRTESEMTNVMETDGLRMESDKTKSSTKIRFYLRTGELEIIHERTDLEK